MVGIGSTNPQSKLSVNTDGNSSTTLMSYATGNKRAGQFELENPSSSSYNIAFSTYIRNQSTGGKNVCGNFYAYQSTTHSKRMFGVRGVAGNGYSGYNYGIIGILSGSRNGAGIVGTITTEPIIDGQYAGYFNGNVHITDILTVYEIDEYSDINLKKDIKNLSDEDLRQIDKLKSLSAIKYKYKTPAELDNFDQVVLDTAKVDPRTKEYNEEKYTKDSPKNNIQ